MSSVAIVTNHKGEIVNVFLNMQIAANCMGVKSLRPTKYNSLYEDKKHKLRFWLCRHNKEDKFVTLQFFSTGLIPLEDNIHEEIPSMKFSGTVPSKITEPDMDFKSSIKIAWMEHEWGYTRWLINKPENALFTVVTATVIPVVVSLQPNAERVSFLALKKERS